jgi:hypothetical protein
MAAINITYNPEEWWLFIDSSMHSLKAVLLHKGNTLPSFLCLCRPQKGNIWKFSAERTTRHISGTSAMICR